MKEQILQLARSTQGWDNHPSANEFKDDVEQLVLEAQSKGFCALYDSVEEAEKAVGKKIVFNKLGLIVKERDGKRKARIIWDLKESKVNALCSQGERILLPRVSDAIKSSNNVFRSGGSPSYLAIDIRDAFHNIPSGKDKAFTASMVNIGDQTKIMVFDVLVFGAVSSPSLWGRFASWIGRALMCVNEFIDVQIYVDDPILVFDKLDPQHIQHVAVGLLWFAITGFPVKLEKSDAGQNIKWIGAKLQVDDRQKATVATIPPDKVKDIRDRIIQMMLKPVVGKRQLQSLAGALSFFAGIVPLLRPFLGAFWSVLTTNDGPKRARQLVHTKRIAQACEWILALLEEKDAPFVRTVRAFHTNSEAIIITDASTWGFGGLLILSGQPVEFFSCPIPYEFIYKSGAIPGLPKHMTLWEACCLLVAARIWLVQFPLGTIVRVKADNIAALHMLARGKARTPELATIARELYQALGCYELTVLQRINTKLNITADPLSRQRDPSPPPFPHQELAGAKRVPVLVDDSFWKIRKFSKEKVR